MILSPDQAGRLGAWLQMEPPYLKGGMDPDVGVDCSGAVNYVLGLPRAVTTATWLATGGLVQGPPERPAVGVYLCQWKPGVQHMGMAVWDGEKMFHVEQGSKGPRLYMDRPWPVFQGYSWSP